MYYVYIIQSIEKQEQTYIGFTENLKTRLNDHNSGKSKHTKKYMPWKILSYHAFVDKKIALDFEKYLKSHSGKSFAKKRLFNSGKKEVIHMKNNTENNRFEIEIDGYTTFANYAIEHGNILYIRHVESAPELRGKGTASKLLHEIMEFAKKEKLKVVPICTFAVSWLKRHQEYKELLK